MSESGTTWAHELEVAKAAARAAGAAVMEFYVKQSAEKYVKKDGSVVTDADLAADRIIRAAILGRVSQRCAADRRRRRR